MTVLTSQQCTEFRPAESSFHFFFWERRFLAAILGPGWRSVASDGFWFKGGATASPKKLITSFRQNVQCVCAIVHKIHFAMQGEKAEEIAGSGRASGLIYRFDGYLGTGGRELYQIAVVAVGSDYVPIGRA